MLNGIAAIAAFLIAISNAGGLDKISVYEWKVSVDVNFYSAAVHVDPVFLVYADETPGSAFTFFNTVVLNERLRGTEKEEYILRHELNHVRQFQALGWMYYPADYWGLEMEWWPSNDVVEWNRPEQNDENMWLPPAWLREFHFLSLELRFG